MVWGVLCLQVADEAVGSVPVQAQDTESIVTGPHWVNQREGGSRAASSGSGSRMAQHLPQPGPSHLPGDKGDIVHGGTGSAKDVFAK